jgi:tRNA-Thr(GGU) m(6)t(6)A37 methyltransferase TsaA
MHPTLTIIGTVNSPLKRLEDCPLQERENAPEATLTIYPEFSEGIQNIKAGAEILILTWLHQADRTVVKCVPRREFDAPQIGVFSSRSPDRPNPIGMHQAKVISVSGNELKVSALEVLDQTPVLDIKPVI